MSDIIELPDNLIDYVKFSLVKNLFSSEGWGMFNHQDFLKDSRMNSFQPGEVIYHENEPGESLHVMRGGMVKLLRHMPNGRARIIRLQTAGDWLDMGVFLGYPQENTAVAIDEVETYVIPVKNLQRLQQNEPQHFIQLMTNCYQHLRDADKRIVEFSTGEIKARTARLLLHLSEIQYGSSSNIVNLLRVYEIAEVLAATPESVSRILAEFKRNGILQKMRKQPDELYKFNPLLLQEVSQ